MDDLGKVIETCCKHKSARDVRFDETLAVLREETGTMVIFADEGQVALGLPRSFHFRSFCACANDFIPTGEFTLNLDPNDGGANQAPADEGQHPVKRPASDDGRLLPRSLGLSRERSKTNRTEGGVDARRRASLLQRDAGAPRFWQWSVRVTGVVGPGAMDCKDVEMFARVLRRMAYAAKSNTRTRCL